MIYLILFPVFLALLLLYFRIANRYNIIDHPNERSSHSAITIRGGGIIFIAAALVLLIWQFTTLYIPLTGIIIIGAISFLDDIYTLSNKVRVAVHIISVSLLFLYLGIFSIYPLTLIIGLYILVIGIINAYNFMDGINGITGCYSLVILAGLQYINIKQTNYINADMIWMPIVACIVFLYFNFRKKARCFAGDVGSVTIAFWIVTLLLKLIMATNNWVYILFLAVYGVDSILTILHRLILKQNIFEAHRLHFYQLLVNEYKMPHLVASAGYALLQLIIIGLIIINNTHTIFFWFPVILLPLIIAYLVIKPRLMKLT